MMAVGIEPTTYGLRVLQGYASDTTICSIHAAFRRPLSYLIRPDGVGSSKFLPQELPHGHTSAYAIVVILKAI